MRAGLTGGSGEERHVGADGVRGEVREATVRAAHVEHVHARGGVLREGGGGMREEIGVGVPADDHDGVLMVVLRSARAPSHGGLLNFARGESVSGRSPKRRARRGRGRSCERRARLRERGYRRRWCGQSARARRGAGARRPSARGPVRRVRRRFNRQRRPAAFPRKAYACERGKPHFSARRTREKTRRARADVFERTCTRGISVGSRVSGVAHESCASRPPGAKRTWPTASHVFFQRWRDISVQLAREIRRVSSERAL